MRSRARQVEDESDALAQLTPIDFLRMLAAGLRSNTLDRGSALHAAELLECYFERACEGWTLDDAFGVAVGRGEKSWLRTELRQQLKQSLGSIDRIISSSTWPMTKRESALRSSLRTYKKLWYESDRQNGVPADANAERAFLFAAFEANRQLQALAELGGNSRLSEVLPMSDSTLRRAIRGCSE
jgi:hypothetical protein